MIAWNSQEIHTYLLNGEFFTEKIVNGSQIKNRKNPPFLALCSTFRCCCLHLTVGATNKRQAVYYSVIRSAHSLC